MVIGLDDQSFLAKYSMTLQTVQKSELTLSDQQSIRINPEPIGKGGEGNVYEVLSPKHLRNYVVKLYHSQERDSERMAKLRYMINHPPSDSDFSLIWPKDIVFEDSLFAGFLMLRANGKYDLSILSSLKLSIRLEEVWHRKFSRSTLEGLMNRAKLCFNVATAIYQLHLTQRYVLVDIKPENIKTQLNGIVSVIDLDSVEIIDRQQLLFPAPKLSLEYSPPEARNIQVKTDIIPETWDRFSMAVVFYKILFGIHPFAVTGKDAYNRFVSHDQKIQAGLFPFGKMRPHIQVVPRPHDNFVALPKSVQELFLRCFDQGLMKPELRPSAREWCEALKNMNIQVQKYQDPLALTRLAQKSKKVDWVFIPKKRTMMNSEQLGFAPIIMMTVYNSLDNLFNGNDQVAIPIFLALLFGIGAGFVDSLKSVREMHLYPNSNTLLIEYKGLLTEKIIREYPINRLVAHYRERTNGDMLKVFYKKRWGGEKEIARVKVDANGNNRELVDNLMRKLESLKVRIKKPRKFWLS